LLPSSQWFRSASAVLRSPIPTRANPSARLVMVGAEVPRSRLRRRLRASWSRAARSP
jgi:hypothetical protein